MAFKFLISRCLSRQNYHSKQLGFTLIEIIIGIVVLAISLSIITTLIVPAEQQSADQIHQIKAAELGQGMLDEILGRAFDENSDHAGSVWRCDETTPVVRLACSAAATFGVPDAGESTRDTFDDVDDYNGFNSKVNSTNQNLDKGYNSFQIAVSVVYDGVALGLANRLAKRVTVTITTPLGTAIEFTGYKSNF